jgi:hypothetical protein
MAVLKKTANTAARQTATPIPRPGQYLYLKDIEFKSAAGAGATGWARECSTVVGQEWMAGDGSGRQLGRYTSSYRGCRGFRQTWPTGAVTTSDNPLDWPKNLLGFPQPDRLLSFSAPQPCHPSTAIQALIRRRSRCGYGSPV